MGTATYRHQVAGEVRAEMARQRKTGVELAAFLECSQQSASRRLTGDVGIDLDELVRIADWLGVETTALLPKRAAS